MTEDRNDQGQESQEDTPNPDAGAVEVGDQGTVTESAEMSDSERELAQLRAALSKHERHSSRRVTALTEGNDELQQALSARDQRIANLESQIQGLSQQQSSNNNYYDDDDAGSNNGNGVVTAEEWGLYKQGMGEMANEVYSLKEQLDSVNAQRQEQGQVQEFSQRFGLSEEDAQLAHQYQQQGDFFSAHRVVELGAVNAKARAEARSRRNSTPSDIGSASASNSESNNNAQVDNILQGQQSPNDIAKQLAEDPSLLDKLAKGFGLGQ